MRSKQTTKKTLFLLASTIVPILFGTTRAVVFQVNTSTLSPRFADLYLFLKTPWASRILKHCKIRQDILWPWHGTVVLKPKKNAKSGQVQRLVHPLQLRYRLVMRPMPFAAAHLTMVSCGQWKITNSVFLESFFLHFSSLIFWMWTKNAELLTVASSVVKIFWCGWPGAPVLVAKGRQQKLLSIGVGFCKSNWLRFGFQGSRYCGW